MKIEKISEPIATRILTAGSDNVTVVIGKPEKFRDGSDYYCPYSIEYRNKAKFSYAGGMDSVQALQLAMRKVGADLIHMGTTTGTAFSWLSDTTGDTGFPS